MKVTEKQIHQLVEIVVDSLRISSDIAFSREDRKTLVQDILNQQSDELIEIN